MKSLVFLIAIWIFSLVIGFAEERDAAGFTSLHTAAEKGRLDEVRKLIAEGANIENISEGGYTPLASASLNGHEEVVLELIRAGAKVNFTGKEEIHPPLFHAAQYARYDVVKILLENGANPNFRGFQGVTSLHVAVQHPQTAKRFMQQYEMPDYSPEIGPDGDRLKIVRLLIESGANVHAKNDFGSTPLHYLAINWDSPKAAELLLEQGADLENPGAGSTPLLCTIEHGQIKLAEFFLKEGADITSTAQSGSVLHWAIIVSRPEMVKLFIEHGADVNAIDMASQTPATMTTYKGQTDILRMLYEVDPEVIHHVPEYENAVPLLHSAARSGHLDMVQFLLDKGVKDSLSKAQGRTALHLASIGMSKLDWLKDVAVTKGLVLGQSWANIQQELDHVRLGNEHLEIVRLLIDNGSDINLRAKEDGASPLDYACNSARSDIVRLLIELGADYTTHDPVQGVLPIHRSADFGDAESVRFFIEKGVSPDALTKGGLTPMHFPTISRFASQKNLVEAIKVLEEAGADLDRYANSRVRTPMYCALLGDNLMVAEYLLQKGVNITSSNSVMGESVYEAAQQKANKPFVAVMSARLNMTPVQGLYSMIGNEDGIIAEIGEDRITVSDVIHFNGGPKTYFSKFRISDLKDPEKISAIMDMIHEKLIADAAAFVAVRLMSEHADQTGRSAKKFQLEQVKQNIIKSSGLSPYNYYINLPRNGWSIDKFDDVCEWLALAGFIESELIAELDPITDEEVENRYNETKSDYLNEAKIRLQLITVADQSTITSIQIQLKSGTGFSDLAKKYSTHETSVIGGDLGWLEVRDINKQFLQSLPELATGTVGSAVKIGNSYYLVYISESMESKPKPLEELVDLIRAELLVESRTPLITQFLKEISEGIEYTSHIDLFWEKVD
jgi:ankyrin repeat protein/parvulin-like peptidyl-prolyl isomerase